MPVQVNVKKIKEFVSSFLVPITSNGVEKGGYGYIASDHWIHRPWIQQDNNKNICGWNTTNHSVPKKVIPGWKSRKTSRPYTRTTAFEALTNLFPARSWSKVDLPAKMESGRTRNEWVLYQTSVCTNENSPRTSRKTKIHIHQRGKRKRVVVIC